MLTGLKSLPAKSSSKIKAIFGASLIHVSSNRTLKGYRLWAYGIGSCPIPNTEQYVLASYVIWRGWGYHVHHLVTDGEFYMPACLYGRKKGEREYGQSEYVIPVPGRCDIREMIDKPISIKTHSDDGRNFRLDVEEKKVAYYHGLA